MQTLPTTAPPAPSSWTKRPGGRAQRAICNQLSRWFWPHNVWGPLGRWLRGLGLSALLRLQGLQRTWDPGRHRSHSMDLGGPGPCLSNKLTSDVHCCWPRETPGPGSASRLLGAESQLCPATRHLDGPRPAVGSVCVYVWGKGSCCCCPSGLGLVASSRWPRAHQGNHSTLTVSLRPERPPEWS